MGDDGARLLSGLFTRRLIRRDRRSGDFEVNLGEGDRTVLKELAPQFTQLLSDPSLPAVRRLFPPAYSDPAHGEQQEEYRRLMQDDLVARHKEELVLLAETADARRLTELQLLGWVRAINSIRLVLGTFLDISDDDGSNEDDPRYTMPEMAVYHWLTYLLGEALEALSGQN